MHPLIPALRSRLAQPLPGLEVQLRMAPPYRGQIMPDVIPDTARPCAVLIPLYLHNGELHTAFMRRAEDGYTHSGQVSFAGGGREAEDNDLTITALREAEEEIGIPRHTGEVIGSLTELYIPPSNSLVLPVVSLHRERPMFVPNPKEVAYIIEAPLAYLRSPQARSFKPMHLRGIDVEMPVFEVDGNIIWGGTAMMLSEFLHVIEECYDGPL